MRFKKDLLKKIPSKMFKVAPIVIKDFDWALINSLLMVFNTCDAIFYVNWCYDILFERTKSIKIYNRMSSIILLK